MLLDSEPTSRYNEDMATTGSTVKRQTMYVVDGTTFLLSALSNGKYWLHVESAEAWCHIACEHGRWHHLADFDRSRDAQEHMRRLMAR